MSPQNPSSGLVGGLNNVVTAYIAVQGEHITRNGEPIILKGAGLGGWMNMENFITGYPGHEYQARAAIKDAIGQAKYDFFFDKFLEYFFGEDDAKFLTSMGLNCLRLPVNYRHFEDDMKPRVFIKAGLKHLDRVIDLCAKNGIFTIIDLHAAPGGQNSDWHADSGNHQALFWEHKDFQDRTIVIWENLARHYKDNTWVAGYNVLNEPTDVQHTRLLAFYARAEKAIRAIDPNHVLFLDGNTFGSDFRRFEDPLPNTVYACHDYSRYGFPDPPSIFTGSKEDIEYHEIRYHRKAEYMQKHGLPVWNGEFGPVYENPTDGPQWEKENTTRLAVLKLQLDIYAKHQTSWSIWTYKDIGFQGMLYAGEDTPYMTRFKPFLDKKKNLAADKWGCNDKPVRHIFEPLEKWFLEAAPSLRDRYPKPFGVSGHIQRVTRNMLLSEELCYQYADYFRDLNMEELDQLAKSFAFENCEQRKLLNDILAADTSRNKAQ